MGEPNTAEPEVDEANKVEDEGEGKEDEVEERREN